MGRRSLPAIDPTVSLAGHLFPLSELQEPFDPQSLFQKPQPLEMEVGSGKGLFLSTHSGDYPDRNYLGAEISSKYSRFAAYRLAKQDRANAVVVAGDGLKLFHQFLPDQCAMAVHVYFPDPWWKERHRRRRIMKAEFVADVERVLVSGGRLHFWTDVAQYFDETLKLLAAESGLNGPIHIPEALASHDMDFRTHFERRMRLHEHDVFRAQFIKP